eukprot:CAMPEP_0184653538 /NCGR_PEP_ID=MMETSP0308-20130426/11255_1 /TAXON_ID=38269 /ORGANISM="Gloeochaete witrockiana, Strain SAG 46.84" /LENGTH=95 /DNA_ID=CAMNT_0027089047 /DNA_START=68 /DNA_END=355 /DNA_ORIENTATION=-
MSSVHQIVSLLLAAGAGAALAFFLLKAKTPAPETLIINKDKPQKYAETLEAGKTVAICRCWASKTFPYCDGSHQAMNAKGDKLSPAVITAQPLPQ